MKSLVLLCTCLCLLLSAQSQVTYQQTSGTSGKPVSVSMMDPSRPDFEVQLINLDHHPIPSAEYGQLKEAVHQRQAQYQAARDKSAYPQRLRGKAMAPVILKGAQGNLASGIPNDNDIAVSNDGKVLSVVNSNMRVYNDTLGILHSQSISSMATAVGVFSYISDPRVLYDPVADRFILVCFSGNLSTNSTILVGFSQTKDPSGSWNFYKLNGNSFNDSTWSDYPIIAISGDDLFITFNQVRDNVSWTIGFKQSVIWQIRKEEGYQGDPLQFTLWSNIQYEGRPLRNICPAKYQETPFGEAMHFLTLRNVAASNDSIFLTTIDRKQSSGQATLKIRVLKSPIAYGFPPNVKQRKTNPQQYLMTNDARVLAAIYENDYIHFGSNTLNPQYMNAGVLLGEIQGVGQTNPLVKGTILSNDSIEYGYPSMAYMGLHPDEHKVLYTFSHCLTDSFPGTSIVYKDEKGQFSDAIITKAGVTNINVLTDTTERWGDYTNIQRRYNKPTHAYLSGSWGKNSGMNCWINLIGHQDSVYTPPAAVETMVYPNPVVNQQINTRFYQPADEQVKIEIFDIQGRRVALLLDTFLKTGNHTLNFSTRPLSPGKYFLKIAAQKETRLLEPILIY